MQLLKAVDAGLGADHRVAEVLHEPSATILSISLSSTTMMIIFRAIGTAAAAAATAAAAAAGSTSGGDTPRLVGMPAESELLQASV